MRDALKVYLPIIVVLVAAGFAVWHLMAPPPPHDLVMASGPTDGAYAAFAERYKKILADNGLTLEVLHTSGSVENQKLLLDGKADVAFIQGGTVTLDPDTGNPPDGIEDIASIYYEPLWVFVRGIQKPERLSQLTGLRLAIGPEGSGTRPLAIKLLAASGVREADKAGTKFLPLTGTDASQALIDGKIDAAFYVTARPSAAMQRLVEASQIHLMDFVQGEAYSHRLAALSAVTLPRGGLNLRNDFPPRPMTLLASAAQLAVRDDINPALVDVLLEAAQRIHRQGELFTRAGTFPSQDMLELPINSQADHFFRSGPSFARRYLPFWAASVVERLLILMLPLLGLAIPMMKFAPSIYNWQVNRRILKWYRHLRRIEDEVHSDVGPERRDELVAEIDSIQQQVGKTKVPSSYSQSLYQLRLHIDLVRKLISASAG
jgi:TRAP transporter TAXI family solute receptor